ncbi:hypothetical protein Sjap_024930 [Stephania japonica]|uniref:Uncharacterized protein n=1 Tax=Stephania japonica TaxID=461633 RepID=A0AAP0HKB5_9MAGN
MASLAGGLLEPKVLLLPDGGRRGTCGRSSRHTCLRIWVVTMQLAGERRGVAVMVNEESEAVSE